MFSQRLHEFTPIVQRQVRLTDYSNITTWMDLRGNCCFSFCVSPFDGLGVQCQLWGTILVGVDGWIC